MHQRIVIATLFLCWSAPAWADLIVVPNDLAATEGDSAAGIMIGTRLTHFQQVYSASQFAGGRETITALIFRPDIATTASNVLSTTYSRMQLSLSTIDKPVNGLSLTFADNIGSDSTVVYDGSLTISTANSGPAGGPRDFDIVINFQSPFSYDPSAGNLLFDLRKFDSGYGSNSGVGRFNFDATDSSSVTSAILYGSGPGGFDPGTPNAPIADEALSGGLVTEFAISSQAVPEPSSFVLLSIGGMGIAAAYCRRRALAG